MMQLVQSLPAVDIVQTGEHQGLSRKSVRIEQRTEVKKNLHVRSSNIEGQKVMASMTGSDNVNRRLRILHQWTGQQKYQCVKFWAPHIEEMQRASKMVGRLE